MLLLVELFTLLGNCCLVWRFCLVVAFVFAIVILWFLSCLIVLRLGGCLTVGLVGLMVCFWRRWFGT